MASSDHPPPDYFTATAASTPPATSYPSAPSQPGYLPAPGQPGYPPAPTSHLGYSPAPAAGYPAPTHPLAEKADCPESERLLQGQQISDIGASSPPQVGFVPPRTTQYGPQAPPPYPTGATAYPPPGQPPYPTGPAYGLPPPQGPATAASPHHRSEDPAYPPDSERPPPYFRQDTQTQSVFSPDFQRQYMADYGGEEVIDSYIPPCAVVPPTNEVTEADNCVCLPDKADKGGCYCYRVFFSTVCHIIFFVSLVGILYDNFICCREKTAVWASLLGVSFFFLWAEHFCSYDWKYLMNITDAEEFKQYMATVHNARPTLQFKVTCYHYRTVYYRDNKGQTRSRREKVVTHRETGRFLYSACRDVAPPNIYIKGAKATRIAFFNTFTFANEQTRLEFERQSAAIRNRNRYRDKHMHYSESFDIPGFEARMLAYTDERARHPCFNFCVFSLLSTVLCTWPYRWWFRRVTAKTTYTFNKELSI